MSAVSIRTALESALAAMTPALQTSWENVKFTPPAASTPYQAAHILFARPDNAETGPSYQELGFMQVTLMYPQGAGSSDAHTRAQLLRQTFRRGTSLTSGSVTVNITDTPEVSPGEIQNGRYALIVKIRFRSLIS